MSHVRGFHIIYAIILVLIILIVNHHHLNHRLPVCLTFHIISTIVLILIPLPSIVNLCFKMLQPSSALSPIFIFGQTFIIIIISIVKNFYHHHPHCQTFLPSSYSSSKSRRHCERLLAPGLGVNVTRASITFTPHCIYSDDTAWSILQCIYFDMIFTYR